MRSDTDLLVFSDLDGTLIDHDTYGWDAARPALTALAEKGAGVILSSSKTAAEISVLRSDMALTKWPAIVENGAGVLTGASSDAAPDQYVKIRQALDALTPAMRAQYTGFGDMTANEVATTTGLSVDAAHLAKKRAYSEPGLWSGDATGQQEFESALQEYGISAREGGRFLTLSFGRNKSDAMAEIIAQFAPRYTVALGDAPNDVEMLQAADYGVIIANPHRAPLPILPTEATGRILRTVGAGPLGWNSAILDLLDRLEL